MRTDLRRLFTSVLADGAGISIEYLFRALFGTDTAAPLANPTAVEVGTIVPTDTGNKMSITGGALALLGKSTWGDPSWRSGATIARSAGNALVFRINPNVYTPTTFYAVFGGYPTTTTSTQPQAGYAVVSGGLSINLAGAELTALPSLEIQEHTVAAIMRSTGAFFVSVDRGRLLWVSKAGTNALYLGGTDYFAQTFLFNEAHAANWGTDWQTDTAFLSANVATPTTGETITHEADCLLEFTWTPGAGETLSLEFRKTDANNLWRLDCAQAGGTIKLWKREAGVETEYSTGKTQTWGVGAAKRIVISMVDSAINVFVADVIKNTTNAAYTQRTATGAKASGFATGANFQAWKSNINSLIPGYIRQTVPAQFLSYGDSKAAESGFPGTFETLTGLRSAVADSASGGTTVTRAASVVSELAAKHGIQKPAYIMCNLGINDVSGGTAEATFKASYLTVLDALHAKWPDAKVGLMKLYRPAGGTDNVNSWIDYVITQRPPFVSTGPDENTFLPGHMADTVHPDATGYALTAAAWQTWMNAL